MPFKDREKLLAWRATPEFKKRNYERVKAWRAKPENKEKRAAEARRWRAKHPELWQEIHDRHYLTNYNEIKARSREAKKKRYAADPDGNRRRSAAFKARIRAEQEAIAGRPKPRCCELCSEPSRRIVFDHCHSQGKFRGWLCDRCNQVLGFVKDDPDLLRRMADYLEEHGSGKIDIKEASRHPEKRLRDPRQTSLSFGYEE
ncbi:MAG TPA: endonuclease domain-containing protein [Terracidiphilus sp.]